MALARISQGLKRFGSWPQSHLLISRARHLELQIGLADISTSSCDPCRRRIQIDRARRFGIHSRSWLNSSPGSDNQSSALFIGQLAHTDYRRTA